MVGQQIIKRPQPEVLKQWLQREAASPRACNGWLGLLKMGSLWGQCGEEAPSCWLGKALWEHHNKGDLPKVRGYAQMMCRLS